MQAGPVLQRSGVCRQGVSRERTDSTARFVSVIRWPPGFPEDTQWWFHLTALVLLSMLVSSMYERFQSLGKGHTSAFMDGVVWRHYEKQIFECR
jgi:hypothetical protein